MTCQNPNKLGTYTAKWIKSTNHTKRPLKRVLWDKQWTCYTRETTLRVTRIDSTHCCRMGCKKHNWGKDLMQIIQNDAEGKVPFCKDTNRTTGPKPVIMTRTEMKLHVSTYLGLCEATHAIVLALKYNWENLLNNICQKKFRIKQQRLLKKFRFSYVSLMTW